MMADTAPFGIPVSKRAWYGLLLIGLGISLLVMGLVHDLVDVSVGPISAGEAAGLVCLAAWELAVIGPLSPFSTSTP